MNENTAQGLVVPAATSRDVLTEILLDGAQRLLGQAIEAEVEGWLESHKHRVDENGHRQVVGNGRLQKRRVPLAACPPVGGRSTRHPSNPCTAGKSESG